jgi:sulfur relay (sulfurtransferase) DsrC/TusE family protein
LCISGNETFNEEIPSGRRGNEVASVLTHVETFFQMTEYLKAEVHTYMTSATVKRLIKFCLKHTGRKEKASEINATQRRKYYS